jgi:hypothetical protein
VSRGSPRLCLAAALFTAVAVGQMYVWAVKKHRRYRKEFGDKYPGGRAVCQGGPLVCVFPPHKQGTRKAHVGSGARNSFLFPVPTWSIPLLAAALFTAVAVGQMYVWAVKKHQGGPLVCVFPPHKQGTRKAHVGSGARNSTRLTGPGESSRVTRAGSDMCFSRSLFVGRKDTDEGTPLTQLDSTHRPNSKSSP